MAGLGSRSYAFVVDWHLRLLGALIWILAAVLVLHPRWPIPHRDLRIALLPAGCLYLLYHPLLEWLGGGVTPGKRVAGLRLVAGDGKVPSVAAILIRNLLRVVDSLPVGYLVGLASCALRADRARLGDLVAGTRLVAAQAAEDGGGAAAAQAIGPLAAELIERWPALEPEQRRAIAYRLLERPQSDGPLGDGSFADLPDAELLRRLRDQSACSASTRRARSAPERRNPRS